MKSKAICSVLLFLIIAVHIAANAVWISGNRAPAMWDQADYLAYSQWYLLELKENGLRGLWSAYAGPNRILRDRAPLLPMLAAPFYRLFGNSQSSAMFVNHLALAVLCLSVFGIGRHIGGEWLGVIAAYLTMLTPAMFGLSREFFVEFPMTAVAAASLYFALRAHRQPFYLSVPMITIFVAAGMLLKVSFPVFAGLPLAVIIVWHIGRFISGKGEVHLWAVSKIGCGVIFALFIAATWYLPNMQQWTQFARENISGARGAQYAAAPMDYLFEQSRMSFLSYHVLALLLLLLISAAAWFTRTAGSRPLRRGETGAAIAAVTAWLLVALFVCLSVTVKDVRLFFPAMPALAILLAMAYRAMARGWRIIPAAALLLFPLAAFFNFSFHGEYDAEVEFRPTNPKVDVMSADYFLGLRPLTPYVHAPDGKTWPAEEIVRIIDGSVPGAVASSPQGGVGVAVIPNNPYLPPNWLRYVAERNFLEGKTSRRTNFVDLDYHDAPTLKTCGERLVDPRRGVQFVVVADGAWQGPNLYAYRIGPGGVEHIPPFAATEPADMTHGDVMQAVTVILRSSGNRLFRKVGETAISGNAKAVIYLNRYAGETIPPDEREAFLRLFDKRPEPADE